MLRHIFCRALPLILLVLASTLTSATTTLAADAQAAAPPNAERWNAYGYNIVAPASIWPMLELLHAQHFDWELASATQRQTSLTWGSLAPNVFGLYTPKQNIIRLSWVLQGSSVEAGTAFLAHELTHLTDDMNGKLGDMTGDVCYDAETRAFVNEANFWQMVFGPQGKALPDAIESGENTKMFAFVGNSKFVDLVVRTTAIYMKQCGTSRSN
jgi:hypothetical protein